MAERLLFDLLVVGGGINGAGIARDAAGRGLSVCLVEQADLAAFASSASTKLIHGGLRYLEYGELRLVREALTERERLLAIAPHIVRPIRFVLPHVEELRPRWQIRLGLLFYDNLGGRKRLEASRAIRLDRDPAGRALKPGFTRGFAYSDCRVDDSRLVLLNALDAAERGATVLTRTRLESARADPTGWDAECADIPTGRRIQVRARALVNASGCWIEAVRRAAGLPAADRVRLVKGSHIVVPRIFDGEQAYTLQNPDRRVVFAIPYEEQFTLIGTTDISYEGDLHDVRVTPAEIAYLCESVNRYFTRTVTAADVAWRYAGVRALHDDHANRAQEVTRDYDLELEHAPNGTALLSVIGGKLSTYRSLAEAALHKLRPLVGGWPHSWTGEAPLPGGDLPGGNFEVFLDDALRRWPFLPRPVARRMAHAYGTRMERIVGHADSLDALGEPLGAGLTAAEVDHLRAEEWAATADDILWRRSKLGLHVPSGAAERLNLYLQARGDAARVGARP
ncbi:MAG: glycerol-3-phosphate dehydrogenase [Steroidobacteraceae bacterium]